jgi:hypothetical protein
MRVILVEHAIAGKRTEDPIQRRSVDFGLACEILGRLRTAVEDVRDAEFGDDTDHHRNAEPSNQFAGLSGVRLRRSHRIRILRPSNGRDQESSC